MFTRKAYFYPFESSHNSYVRLQQASIKQCGFQLLPFRQLLIDLFKCNGGKQHIIVLNWLESQAVRSDGTLSLKHFLSFFLKVAVIWLSRNRVIWVRHNYKSHAAKGLSRYVSGVFQKILSSIAIADDTICHAKDKLQARDIYIPHPLYFEGELPSKSSNNVNRDNPHCVCIGGVMPYKGLDDLLAIWPQGVQLSIYGKLTDQAFGRKLREIVKSRGLSVAFDFAFLHQHRLAEVLLDSQVMVVPNKTDTSFVSGNYFLAKSYGLQVLGNAGAIDTSLAAMGTYIFDDAASLSAALKNISTCNLNRQDIQRQAIACYGKQACQTAWAKLLAA